MKYNYQSTVIDAKSGELQFRNGLVSFRGLDSVGSVAMERLPYPSQVRSLTMDVDGEQFTHRNEPNQESIDRLVLAMCEGKTIDRVRLTITAEVEAEIEQEIGGPAIGSNGSAKHTSEK
jgi:hypothetical protein